MGRATSAPVDEVKLRKTAEVADAASKVCLAKCTGNHVLLRVPCKACPLLLYFTMLAKQNGPRKIELRNELLLE